MEAPGYLKVEPGPGLTVTVQLVIDTPRKALAFAWDAAWEGSFAAWWHRPAVFFGLLLWGFERVLVRAAGLLTLLALAVAVLPSPAYAADVAVPGVDDFNTKALASIAVVELAAIAWLARALLGSFEKRLEEQDRAHVRAQETHANVVKLGLQTTEAVAVLGEAVDLVTRRDP